MGAAAALHQSPGKLIIVSDIIGDRRKPAGRLQVSSPEAERRAETEFTHPNKLSDKSARHEIDSDPEGLPMRSRAMANRPIEAGDNSDVSVAQWSNYSSQIIGRDQYVAVAHYPHRVARKLTEMRERTHLGVCRRLGAHMKSNGHIRKIAL